MEIPKSKLEIRKWKSETQKARLAPRSVTPAKAGIPKVVDSRLRGNDRMGRLSSFDFRISGFGVRQDSGS
jgi:hypothetical protein